MRAFADLTRTGRGRRLRSLAVAAVVDGYGLSDADVRLISMHSFNSIFQVRSAGSRYALRVGDACRIHPIGVEDVEAGWLAALNEEGFVVPRNVPSGDGRRWLSCSHPGVPEPRMCSMFTWLDGRPLRERLNADRMRAAGSLLARLHDHASRYVPRDAIPQALHADRVVYFHEENRLQTYASPYGSLFVDAMDRVQGELDRLWASPPHPPHLLHGDFGPNNVLCSRAQLATIDFQDLRFGFDLQDVAISLADLRRTVADMIEPFRSGYAAVRGWPQLSPALEAALAAARSLNIMNLGLHLRRPGIEPFLERHAQLVTAWMNGSGVSKQART